MMGRKARAEADADAKSKRSLEELRLRGRLA